MAQAQREPPAPIATREWPTRVYPTVDYHYRLAGPAVGFFWSGTATFRPAPNDPRSWTVGIGETNGKPSLRIDEKDTSETAFAAASFVEQLTTSIYLLRKPKWHRGFTPPLRSFQRGADIAAVMLAPLASPVPASKAKKKGKAELERGVVGTLRADVYRLALYETRVLDAVESEVAALLAEGYVERPGPGARTWPEPPKLTGVISWTGADGSRLDLSIVDKSADRIQYVSATGELVFRSHRRALDGDREFKLVLEYPRSIRNKILTASVFVNRGGDLTTLWKHDAEHAVPDPSPLPLQ